jgi:hypothetical protein
MAVRRSVAGPGSEKALGSLRFSRNVVVASKWFAPPTTAFAAPIPYSYIS